MTLPGASITSIDMATPPRSFDFSPADAKPDALSAAREFEALLIARLLKTAREAGQALGDTSIPTGAEGYLELAEEHVARVMAQRGAFGIAHIVFQGLEGPYSEHAAPAVPNHVFTQSADKETEGEE
jgi:Rod binding domain-containing protein